MAKIAFGVVVSEARGKVGGGVFTKTRSGSVLRRRAIPTNPQTALQTAVRAILTTISQMWKTLTDAQRDAWDAAGQAITRRQSVSGQSYHPTGFNYFVELSAKFLHITPGGAVPDDPPAAPYVDDTITVAFVGGVNEVTTDPSAANAAGKTTEILYQRLSGEGEKPRTDAMQHLDYIDYPDGTAVDIPLTPGFYALGYRFCEVATGRTGPIFTPADNVVEVTAA